MLDFRSDRIRSRTDPDPLSRMRIRGSGSASKYGSETLRGITESPLLSGRRFFCMHEIGRGNCCIAKIQDFMKEWWIVTRAGEPEPGAFGSLEPRPEPVEKKNQEPEPLLKKEPEPLQKKMRSRSRFKNKWGAGAAWKKGTGATWKKGGAGAGK